MFFDEPEKYIKLLADNRSLKNIVCDFSQENSVKILERMMHVRIKNLPESKANKDDNLENEDIVTNSFKI